MTDAEEFCHHLDQVQEVNPSSNGCEDCLREGGQWVHLRLCMLCGHVGCCDASPNHHATAHWHAHTDHPIIRSYEPGEDLIEGRYRVPECNATLLRERR